VLRISLLLSSPTKLTFKCHPMCPTSLTTLCSSWPLLK
jgi:hypothetical protein